MAWELFISSSRSINLDPEKLREAFKRHVESLNKIQGRREPKPGELAKSYLEEEFDDESIY
jgi:hypothetical protein